MPNPLQCALSSCFLSAALHFQDLAHKNCRSVATYYEFSVLDLPQMLYSD